MHKCAHVCLLQVQDSDGHYLHEIHHLAPWFSGSGRDGRDARCAQGCDYRCVTFEGFGGIGYVSVNP